jgi:hypothetical protein
MLVFDRKRLWMSSLLRIASGKENAHDAGHERRGNRRMVERDPEKFLSALIDAFRNRQEADTSLKPQYMFFCASMSAVPVRLTALDSLAEQFPRASMNANTDLSKRREQNQILFDFFSNALASFQSFCCGSYFVGRGT